MEKSSTLNFRFTAEGPKDHLIGLFQNLMEAIEQREEVKLRTASMDLNNSKDQK